MSYLNRNGERTNFHPEDLIENDGEMSVEVRYEVQLLNEDNETVATEDFHSYPNTDSIRWCFLRHKGKQACKANVKKIYVPYWD